MLINYETISIGVNLEEPVHVAPGFRHFQNPARAPNGKSVSEGSAETPYPVGNFVVDIKQAAIVRCNSLRHSW